MSTSKTCVYRAMGETRQRKHIDTTDHVKYLGLTIKNNLSVEYIVNNILGKVNARLCFIGMLIASIYKQGKLFLQLSFYVILITLVLHCFHG